MSAYASLIMFRTVTSQVFSRRDDVANTPARRQSRTSDFRGLRTFYSVKFSGIWVSR